MRENYEHRRSGSIYSNANLYRICDLHPKKVRGKMEDKAKFKTYEGICPVCGETMWICKSIGMKIGINAGIGNCP